MPLIFIVIKKYNKILAFFVVIIYNIINKSARGNKTARQGETNTTTGPNPEAYEGASWLQRP